MWKYSIDGVTAEVVLDKRRKKEKDTYPVKIRVTYLRKQVYFSTGKDITEEVWKNLPETKKRSLIEIRELLEISFNQFREHLNEIFKLGKGFSFDLLQKRVSRGNKHSILSQFENKISELVREGQIGTKISYECTLKSIKKFDTSPDIVYSDITIDWLKRYEKWMLEQGNGFTTIGIYLRQLRAIINSGIKEGIITEAQYPFGVGKYEIPISKGNKKAINLEAIEKLISFPLLPGSVAEKCRDLWYFSYLCNGINILDICLLKYSSIINQEITFYRHKTIRTKKEKVQVRAFINPEIEKIIKKWGNPETDANNYIFPFFKKGLTPEEEKKISQNLTSLINKNIKRIANKAGIESISTYTARHSFATILKNAGVNIAFISESMGHSNLKTTENYLASFEKEERVKNSNLLLGKKPKNE